MYSGFVIVRVGEVVVVGEVVGVGEVDEEGAGLVEGTVNGIRVAPAGMV